MSTRRRKATASRDSGCAESDPVVDAYVAALGPVLRDNRDLLRREAEARGMTLEQYVRELLHALLLPLTGR